MNPQQFAQCFKILPKWQNFGKSGHNCHFKKICNVCHLGLVVVEDEQVDVGDDDRLGQFRFRLGHVEGVAVAVAAT